MGEVGEVEGREIDRGGEWGCGLGSVGTVSRPHPPGGWRVQWALMGVFQRLHLHHAPAARVFQPFAHLRLCMLAAIIGAKAAPVTQSGEHDMPGHHGHRRSPPSQPPLPTGGDDFMPLSNPVLGAPPFLTSGSKMGVFNSRPS